LAMRSQGFVHPATLVPSELEYAEGYRARMNVLWSKMKSLGSSHASHTHHQQKPKTKARKKK